MVGHQLKQQMYPLRNKQLKSLTPLGTLAQDASSWSIIILPWLKSLKR